jgi:hypothetical protein
MRGLEATCRNAEEELAQKWQLFAMLGAGLKAPHKVVPIQPSSTLQSTITSAHLDTLNVFVPPIQVPYCVLILELQPFQNTSLEGFHLSSFPR